MNYLKDVPCRVISLSFVPVWKAQAIQIEEMYYFAPAADLVNIWIANTCSLH